MIDLSGIDAVSGGADDSFVFTGDAPFSGTAGGLRVEQLARHTVIMSDVDGDGTADFSIGLRGVVPLGETDFIL